MAKKSREDNLECVKNGVYDKEFNEWRQPVPPKSPKSPAESTEGHSETTTKSTTATVCGVKDLSRLSRKRRTAKNGRFCSRKRSEDKEFGCTLEAKPRVSKRGTCPPPVSTHNKQLLDEAEHDIKNYPDRDQCYLLNPKAHEADNIDREALPMRLRSLPQSFFEQPNSIKSSSMAQNTYSRLPPLFPQDHNPDEETTERPVTPPEERQQPKPPKRVIMGPPDTELLFSLFKTVIPNHLEKKLVKRGRPKKVHLKSKMPLPNHEEDPCMVENLARKIFPQLSLENRCKLPSNVRLATVLFTSGNNTVELPMLAVDNNYPQMLSDLVMNM